MKLRSLVGFLVVGAGAAIASAQQPTGFGAFIDQISGSADIKTLQGSRLSGIGRVASTMGSPRNGSITPDNVHDDARLNFGYDYFRPQITGHRFFNVDNKADQLAPAKAALAKFRDECVSKTGSVETDDSRIAARFWKDYGERFRTSDYYFTNAVMTSVCVGTGLKPLGGFVAITRTLKTQVFFVRNNRTAVYAIKGDSIASTATFAAEEEKRLRAEALARGRERQAQQVAAVEQRRLDAWRKTIGLGTMTNCGLVIDVRGPLLHVQLPGNWTGPNGLRDFWIKRSELTDHSPVYQCTFGN